MALELLELQVQPAGALELLIRADSDDLTVAVEEIPGALWELTPVRETAGRDMLVDLLRARDVAAPPWRMRGEARGAVLEAGDAAAGFAQTLRTGAGRMARDARAASAAVVLADPLTSSATPILPGRRYSFEVELALEGGAGELSLVLSDAQGGQLDLLRRQIGAGRGSAPERVRLVFTAPEGACSLNAAVQLAPAGGAEARVRLGHPALIEATAEEEGPRPPLMALPRTALEQVRRGGAGRIVRLRVPLPVHLLDDQPHRLALHLWSGNQRLVKPAFDFAFRRLAQLGKYTFEPSGALRLSGRASDHALAELRLQLLVDGEPSNTVSFSCAKGKFSGLLPAGSRHLDGRAHVLEVREAETQAPLCSARAVLPRHTILFSALQSHAKAPLSAGVAPALPHHRRAYELWARKAARGVRPPDLPALQYDLLAGIRKQTAYSPLAFPAPPARPKVSVIVPAHNKFEVTHFGLTALLFAANRASFEVIVVDDGSSDQTGQIEQLVQGVRVVRHDRAQGFVAACNDGAAAAKGEFLVFLNNDTEVTSGWLDELLAVFDGVTDAGLVGCKLVYPDGRLQEAGGIVWGSGDPWNVGRNGKADDPAFNYLRQVDYASGAAIMLPRRLWREVGGFSREYAPAYFEDTDLAMKVLQRGYKVLYAPRSVVYHHEGQSAGVDVGQGMKRFQEVNRPKFKQKWRSLYGDHNHVVGDRPEREKDRGAVLRALMVEPRAPAEDAAGRARFDLARALMRLGVKVTLLPWDLVWRRDIAGLQRSGVECLHAPFVRDPCAYLRTAAEDYDLVIMPPVSFAPLALAAARAGARGVRLVIAADQPAEPPDGEGSAEDPDWLAQADLLVSRGPPPPAWSLVDRPKARLPDAGEGDVDLAGLSETLRLALADIDLFGAAEPHLVLAGERPLRLA